MNTPGYVLKHGINQHLFKCVQPCAQKQRNNNEEKQTLSGLFIKTWNKSTPLRK